MKVQIAQWLQQRRRLSWSERRWLRLAELGILVAIWVGIGFGWVSVPVGIVLSSAILLGSMR